MTRKVDLNADMGEGFGPWRMGDDAALLDIVSSANVACGFHVLGFAVETPGDEVIVRRKEKISDVY